MAIAVRRWAAVVALTMAAVMLGAGIAQAKPIAPAEDKAMLRASDLQSVYGHVTHAYGEDIGKGRRPTACENPVDGTVASPKKAAKHAMYKEIAFPAGVVWQNSVFVYPSALAAQEAFRQMSTTALAACNMSKVINIGTDGDHVDARVTYRTTMLTPIKGVSRFSVEYDTDLVSAASPSATYSDQYDYSVYALSDKVITRVGVVQIAQTSQREHTDAEALAPKIAARVAAVQK